MDFTAAWHWPQWAFIIWLFLTLLVAGAKHGEPRVQLGGEQKGQPERYNFMTVLVRSAILLFILIAGGFYG